jgi:hypothetical protein
MRAVMLDAAQVLWESETATDAEIRARKAKLIRETGANDPAIGYNLSPLTRSLGSSELHTAGTCWRRPVPDRRGRWGPQPRSGLACRRWSENEIYISA